MQALATSRLGFSYSTQALLAHGALIWLLCLVAFPALSRPLPFIAAIQCANAFVLAMHPLKIAALGSPVFYTDLNSAVVLLRTLPLWITIGVALAFALLLALLLVSLRKRASSVFAVLGLAGVLIAFATYAAPLLHRAETGFDAFKAASESVERVAREGPLAFVVNDRTALLNAQNRPPEGDAIARILEGPWRGWQAQAGRNVHLVLFEGLWDVSAVANVRPARDPFDPRLRNAWESQGSPRVLTPVFGGGTANSEFEALCGLPAHETAITFVSEMRKDMMCLPAMFAALGYSSIANHAHRADNWNRKSAYALAGFNQYRAIGSFRMDDLDGDYLTDRSFFAQNRAALQGHRGPVFNYLVTLSTHWYYPRNQAARPDVISIDPASGYDTYYRYVNSLRYSTTALMDWAEQVLAEDPDALIVVFGDHAPVISDHRDVSASDARSLIGDLKIRDAGVVADSDATGVLVGLSRTPLLVLGRTNGVAIPTEMPLYEMPRLMADLLGLEGSLPQLDMGRGLSGDLVVRRYVTHVLARRGGVWKQCPDTASWDCKLARESIANRDKLRTDAAYGAQHTYALAGIQVGGAGSRGMAVLDALPACQLHIADLSPRTFVLNEAEGHQIQINYEGEARGTFVLRIGAHAAALSRSDGSLQVGADMFPELKQAGRYPASIHCEESKASPQSLGYITAEGAGNP